MFDARTHYIATSDGDHIEIYGTIRDVEQHQTARLNRQAAYNIGRQLNYLYDDVEAGLFGEAARTGQFATYLKTVKDQWPLPEITTPP